MKFSLKELLVKKQVKTKMAWRGTFCSACNHKVWLETMHKIGASPGQVTKYFCWDCCETKEDAFDIVFPKHLTAQEIINRREKKKVQETLVDLFNEIDELPDGEVSPSVSGVLLRYSIDIK